MALHVRPLEPLDLEAIVALDATLTGRTRPAYWRTRFDISALRPPWMSLVAERHGRVEGFLFGWVGESEFGTAGATGWIDLVGVHPAARGQGLARALLARFVDAGRELRALRRVATLVDLGQPDVREFFIGHGFVHGPLVQLERSLEKERTP